MRKDRSPFIRASFVEILPSESNDNSKDTLKIIKDRFILSRELMNDKSSGLEKAFSRLPRLKSTKAANGELASSGEKGEGSRPGRRSGRGDKVRS